MAHLSDESSSDSSSTINISSDSESEVQILSDDETDISDTSTLESSEDETFGNYQLIGGPPWLKQLDLKKQRKGSTQLFNVKRDRFRKICINFEKLEESVDEIMSADNHDIIIGLAEYIITLDRELGQNKMKIALISVLELIVDKMSEWISTYRRLCIIYVVHIILVDLSKIKSTKLKDKKVTFFHSAFKQAGFIEAFKNLSDIITNANMKKQIESFKYNWNTLFCQDCDIDFKVDSPVFLENCCKTDIVQPTTTRHVKHGKQVENLILALFEDPGECIKSYNINEAVKIKFRKRYMRKNRKIAFDESKFDDVFNLHTTGKIIPQKLVDLTKDAFLFESELHGAGVQGVAEFFVEKLKLTKLSLRSRLAVLYVIHMIMTISATKTFIDLKTKKRSFCWAFTNAGFCTAFNSFVETIPSEKMKRHVLTLRIRWKSFIPDHHFDEIDPEFMSSWRKAEPAPKSSTKSKKMTKSNETRNKRTRRTNNIQKDKPKRKGRKSKRKRVLISRERKNKPFGYGLTQNQIIEIRKVTNEMHFLGRSKVMEKVKYRTSLKEKHVTFKA